MAPSANGRGGVGGVPAVKHRETRCPITSCYSRALYAPTKGTAHTLSRPARACRAKRISLLIPLAFLQQSRASFSLLCDSSFPFPVTFLLSPFFPIDASFLLNAHVLKSFNQQQHAYLEINACPMPLQNLLLIFSCSTFLFSFSNISVQEPSGM